MAYAAREGRLLVAVCLCGVGFSAGVPRPVRAWTALRACGGSGSAAGCSGPTTESLDSTDL